MQINELLEKMNKRIAYGEDLIKRSYIPFAEKVQIVDILIDALAYRVNGILTIDTNELDMNAFIAFVQAYTTLSFDNGVDDYDVIMKKKIDAEIIRCIGDDYHTLTDMLEFKLDDLMKQNNTVEAVINRQLGVVVDALTETIKSLDTKIQDTDIRKLSKSLSKGVQDILNSLK